MKTEWLISCNTDYYDIINAFKELSIIEWKQSITPVIGDIVFIYVTKSKSVRYRCVVNDINIETPRIDDSKFTIDDTKFGNYGKYMELKLLENFDEQLLPLSDLKSHGLKTVEWATNLSKNPSLHDYIYEIISEYLLDSEYDRNYPSKYKTELGITQKNWEEMLVNENIFKEKDIIFIKRLYSSPHHGNKCKYLAIEEGVAPQSYNKPVVALARRIQKHLSLNPIFNDKDEEVFWRVPFWGFKDKDGLFEWKLKPELAKAVETIFPELLNSIINDEQDEKLINELKNINLSNIPETFEYSKEIQTKPEAISSKGHKSYPRDRNISINALVHADFCCELDKSHTSFISQSTHKRYMEPHHLIPIGKTDLIGMNLDREQNIVSLCSNCHNEIHYGENRKQLVEILFIQRKELLEEIGINIDLNSLLSFY